MYDEDKITYFGETDFRNKRTKFGIKAKDRTRHIYVIGKTGMGKSTLLENLAIQDIQNDEGIIFIDPHGSTAVKLLEYVPRHRIEDVVYFAPADTDFPIAFNVLEQVPKEKRNAVAGGLMSAFKKIWVDSFSSRMEYLLNYTLLALLDVPGSTLLGINRLLADKVYRKYIVDRVEDTLVKNFWTQEFDKYSTSYATEAVAPIQNKVGQFIASPMIRNIVGQEISTFDFRTFMDQKKIVIINISKGIIGPENMRLLGGMLITKIQLAAMSRANLSEEALRRIPNTYLYVDEFQNFANESFAEILSESRKYKLALTVANQYIDQMTEEVRNAVIGNVGTFISFRVGSTDAEIMEKEFAPNFVAEDMVNLGFTQMYLKLMIDGIGSKPFSASSMPPIPKPEKKYVEEIVSFSRKHYAGEKPLVEEEIKKWTHKDYNLEIQKTMPPKPVKKPDVPTGNNNQKPLNNHNGNKKDNNNRSKENNNNNIKPQVVKDEREERIAKEIEKVVKIAEEREESARRKAFLNLQKVYALKTNGSYKKNDIQKKEDRPKQGAVTSSKKPETKFDEVPEDVLKALLDMSDL